LIAHRPRTAPSIPDRPTHSHSSRPVPRDAHVFVLSTLAHAKLLFGDLEGSKTGIDTAWKTLDNLDAVENTVNDAYYRVAADYDKVRLVVCIFWGGV
jgi:hypothetical protein